MIRVLWSVEDRWIRVSSKLPSDSVYAIAILERDGPNQHNGGGGSAGIRRRFAYLSCMNAAAIARVDLPDRFPFQND